MELAKVKKKLLRDIIIWEKVKNSEEIVEKKLNRRSFSLRVTAEDLNSTDISYLKTLGIFCDICVDHIEEKSVFSSNQAYCKHPAHPTNLCHILQRFLNGDHRLYVNSDCRALNKFNRRVGWMKM
jgi:hypothetical protein